MNLFKTSITPKGLKHICDGMNKLKSLKSINIILCLNKIGVEGAKYIGNSLKGLNCLKKLSLDLFDCDIGLEKLESLSESIS